MKCLLVRKRSLYLLLFLAVSTISFCVFPLKAQLLSPPSVEVYGPPFNGVISEKINPPDVVINEQKIIFKKPPLFDGDIWLFPLEEIAAKLQDKVRVDLVNGIITIERIRDKSIVQLNVKTGVVAVNNRPFRTLFGYEKIVLAPDGQMVPTSALVILLGLTSKDDDLEKLVLKSTIATDSQNIGTIQPLARQGIKDLLVDYLTVTNSFNSFRSEGVYTRRTEINTGFHNDKYALTSDFISRAGSGSPLFNFDSANVSYYKNESPFQLSVGDKTLSNIRSPLLGGTNFRGIQIQKEGKLKSSKLIFGAGLLPTNSKVVGRALPFVKYGRVTQIAEWSSSPEKEWQFSIGEALFSDRIPNLLIKSKQSGALLAGNITKTGKFIEGDTNLAFSVANDVNKGSQNGFGGDTLLRFKPKEWLSLFTDAAYFTPGFYPLSSNTFYNDRNQIGGGLNINLFRSNLGISHSVGKTELETSKPNDFDVTNINFSSTPFKKGPTFLASYSQNKSRISSTRAIDDLLFPINDSTISTVDFETFVERRTNSFFRASILKSWPAFSFSGSINHFTFENKVPLNLSLFGKNNSSITELSTYDLNLSKSINRRLTLQTFVQGSEKYKQARLGFIVGPLFNNKLNFQVQTGALLQEEGSPSPVNSINLNYQVSKKNQLSINYNKTPFSSWLSAIWQYNHKPLRPGSLLEVGGEQTIGRIRGKVLVLQEHDKSDVENNKIFLPSTTLESGLANIRVHLGNHSITTDEKGIFEFESVSPGIHTIKVEYSDLPAYLTSITPEKVDVNVEPGKETNFNFVLAYFGSLKGRIKILGEPELKVEKETELQDIRVYLDNTNFETLTNIDGTFEIGDIKPGKYKLRVDPDFLPEELETSNEEIEVNINPKQEIQNIYLPIKFKSRQKEIKEF